MDFKYSKEWYEREYHTKGFYHLTERDYESVMTEEWDKTWHKKRFDGFLRNWGESLNGKTCIDIGCHHGKSIWWSIEMYPDIVQFDGVDFSKVAIDWCKENCPPHLKDKTNFWEMDVSDMGDIPDEEYDVVFCVDMIEHLPEDIYLKMVEGIKRITKQNGQIVCFVGKTELPEHIHIISDEKVASDFGYEEDFGGIINDDKRYFVLRKDK